MDLPDSLALCPDLLGIFGPRPIQDLQSREIHAINSVFGVGTAGAIVPPPQLSVFRPITHSLFPLVMMFQLNIPVSPVPSLLRTSAFLHGNENRMQLSTVFMVIFCSRTKNISIWGKLNSLLRKSGRYRSQSPCPAAKPSKPRQPLNNVHRESCRAEMIQLRRVRWKIKIQPLVFELRS